MLVIKKIKDNPKWAIVIALAVLMGIYLYYLNVQKLCGCLPPGQ